MLPEKELFNFNRTQMHYFQHRQVVRILFLHNAKLRFNFYTQAAVNRVK